MTTCQSTHPLVRKQLKLLRYQRMSCHRRARLISKEWMATTFQDVKDKTTQNNKESKIFSVCIAQLNLSDVERSSKYFLVTFIWEENVVESMN